MSQNFPVYSSQFFTATIYQWNHLLANDHHKDIIVESLRFLVTGERIELNAFVIMSNPRLTGRAGYSFDMATFDWFYTFRSSGIIYEIYSSTTKTFTFKK